jgi:hypothetical protein
MLEGIVQEHQARVKKRNRGAGRRIRQAANANAKPEPSYIKTYKAAGLGTRDSRTTASCPYKAPNVYPCVPEKKKVTLTSSILNPVHTLISLIFSYKLYSVATPNTLDKSDGVSRDAIFVVFKFFFI